MVESAPRRAGGGSAKGYLYLTSQWGGPPGPPSEGHPLSSTKFGVRVFSSPSFLRIARSSNLQRPSLPFPHLRTALPSEPGPVKAERSDRREQASRRVAWRGGCDGAPLVRREWEAAQRRCTLSSRRSRLLSLLPVRRVRLLPFALLSSPCSSCACWSSRLLPGAAICLRPSASRYAASLWSRPGRSRPNLAVRRNPRSQSVLFFATPRSSSLGFRFPAALRLQAATGCAAWLWLARNGSYTSPVTHRWCSRIASFRATAMRAFFLAPLPPRAASFCPHRRKSLSVPWRPRITCAPCTSSFRR